MSNYKDTAASAQQDEREALPAVIHTLAGFRGGWIGVHGHPPQEQDIWNAGVRSGVERAAQQVQADAGAVAKVLSEEEMGIGFDRKYGPVIWLNGYPKPGYLYTHPAGESDKRDAQRYQKLRKRTPIAIGILLPDDTTLFLPARTPRELDSAIDAMSREQSGGDRG